MNTDECNESLASFEDLLDIVTVLENVKSATFSQTTAKKNEDKARAQTLGNALLQNLTAVDKEQIKSSELAEMETSSAKKQPPNYLLSDHLYIWRNTLETLDLRMEMKAQKETGKD